MTNKPMGARKSESRIHLRNICEQAIAVLCQDDGANEPSPDRPIRGKFLPLHIDAVSLRKRALQDAANALATLWGIS